jgi:hypothetical protein
MKFGVFSLEVDSNMTFDEILISYLNFLIEYPEPRYMGSFSIIHMYESLSI